MVAEPCPDCKITSPGEECPSCGTLVTVAGDEMGCPVCNNVIDSALDLCPHCGTEFEWVDEDETPPEQAVEQEEADYDLDCPECGNPVSVDDEACPHCGTGLEFVEEPEEPEEPVEAPIVAKKRFSMDLKGLFRSVLTERPKPSEEAVDAQADEPAEAAPSEQAAEAQTGGRPAATPSERAAEPSEIDEDMDLDAEIGRITEKEAAEERSEEAELSPEMVQELFDKALEELGDPYDVKNPTQEYTEAVAPLMEKWALASEMHAPLGEADRLFDETYIMAKNQEFPAAVRVAKEAEGELDRRIEDALFYRHSVIKEALPHLSEEAAAEAAALLDESQELIYAEGYAKAKLAMEAAVDRIAEDRPFFKDAEELGRVLARHLATAERFLVDTREARELVAHSRDYHRRGDWKSCVQVCEGALERLRPALRRVAEQELDALKGEMVRLKRANKADEKMVAAAADATDFISNGEDLPALEHIHRLQVQLRGGT